MMPDNKSITTKIVRSLAVDPWHNLALEEHLLNQVAKNEIILYLWQNNDTVVIGRNQNPWKECRYQELEEAGGKLARRLSGGGAVFHDLGNLNFTFIMDKDLFDLTKQLEVILRAVRELGIDAQFSGRNDLMVEGKKFSGNAFYHGNISSYHHGTILINTDAQKLAKFLQVSQEKIISKGIDSVLGRVINLNSLEPSITVDTMINSLMKSFSELYGGSPHATILDISTFEVQELYNKYASWEWRYGQTPKFDFVIQNRFPWGSIEMGLALQNGRISSATIYSDAMNSDLILKLASWLKGLPFQMDVIANCIASKNFNLEDRVIINDLQKWLLAIK